jgi:hypothetical protein
MCGLVLLWAALSPAMAFAHGTRSAVEGASYHPGTAAAPYAWANVIADFDADGAPDVAVANRTNPRGGSRYEIEVQLSGSHAQVFVFDSVAGALTITALDIDNDHDADLVVTPFLSRDVVGVWLNDGTGHFDAGASDSFPDAAARLARGPAVVGFPDHIAAVASDRRATSLAPILVADAIQADAPGMYPCASVALTNLAARSPADRAPPLRS